MQYNDVGELASRSQQSPSVISSSNGGSLYARSEIIRMLEMWLPRTLRFTGTGVG
jgi:hypothetical protein